jgi:hypothetical protein
MVFQSVVSDAGLNASRSLSSSMDVPHMSAQTLTALDLFGGENFSHFDS